MVRCFGVISASYLCLLLFVMVLYGRLVVHMVSSIIMVMVNVGVVVF